ncbi:organelle RRM domain-containing protein 6, chloroplastic [Andrographis paniculata]|uniref:organelle RRM domain-containing protein 6, chloroplastic n=1 Tax=Andrographis paniculata TaxID=175694 RepID=UPI0021E6E69C|nr:organelle RRM domain-containing protein 6, chloroplastic [Andrographis paniculata]
MSAAVLGRHVIPERFLPPPRLSPSAKSTVIEYRRRFHSSLSAQTYSRRLDLLVAPCRSSSSSTSRFGFNPSTRLFVSGLSFRTTEESLRKAFEIFGELEEVNLVMDNIAKRPRGFAFVRYTTEEEANKAIEGMHGKFLDGRVIFVEVAKSRAELRQGFKHNRTQS